MDYLITRLGCSFVAGVLLSQAGSLIQLSTRNLLASPSTLGFDGLSILWVLVFNSILLILDMNWSPGLLLLSGIPLFIILGFVFRYFLSDLSRFERIILLGLTFNLLVGAVFSLWQFLFLAFNLPFPVELWFGHFRFADLNSFVVLLITELALLLGYFALSKDLLLISFGPLVHSNWELNQKKLFGFIFTSVSIVTFVVISYFGSFAFIGLIFPIMARKLWFHRWDLPGEFVWGAFINGMVLMTVDAFCYHFPIQGAEVPVGLIVTAIGALSLITLLWQGHKDSEFLAKPKK